jgi:hypothetical protein
VAPHSAAKDVRSAVDSAAGMVLVLQHTLRRGQPMTFITAGKRPSTPAGVSAISRGLSEATPPDTRSLIEADPGGVAAALSTRTAPHSDQAGQTKISNAFEACRISCAAGTPAGVRPRSRFRTAGVASLNPRLMAATPAGVEMKITTPRCAVEIEPLGTAR